MFLIIIIIIKQQQEYIDSYKWCMMYDIWLLVSFIILHLLSDVIQSINRKHMMMNENFVWMNFVLKFWIIFSYEKVYEFLNYKKQTHFCRTIITMQHWWWKTIINVVRTRTHTRDDMRVRHKISQVCLYTEKFHFPHNSYPHTHTHTYIHA